MGLSVFLPPSHLFLFLLCVGLYGERVCARVCLQECRCMSAFMCVYVKAPRLVSRIFLDHFSTFFFLEAGSLKPKAHKYC